MGTTAVMNVEKEMTLSPLVAAFQQATVYARRSVVSDLADFPDSRFGRFLCRGLGNWEGW